MEDMEYSYAIKIPKERVAVLIGKNGRIKKDIEKATNSKIKIDSKEGDVVVSGDDAVGLMTAQDITKAIARGFNPEIAELLLSQDYCFELINISDFTGRSKKTLQRLKGRIIGEEGKTRKTIETLTQTNISVYGKTAGVIGKHINVSLARKALESLLSGAKHASVYRVLEKKSKNLKIEAIDTNFEEVKDE